MDIPKLAADLAKETDRLNEAICEAEDAVCDLNLGVFASVPFEGDRGPAFGFGKVDGEWGFLVVDVAGGKTAILRASREHRAAATALVQKLIDALIAEAERQLAAMRAANERLEAFNAAFRAARAASSEP